MGIDIYARWDGQTEAQIDKQYRALLSIEDGHVGYLREAYHGKPYATKFLVREAFESDESTAAIPAETLRERLPETLRIAEERERSVYGHTKHAEIWPAVKSYCDFVELCERKERETGEPVTIIASF